MTPVTAAIGSAVIVTMFFVVILGRITYIADMRNKAQTAIIFHQIQTITDLEQRVKPFDWELRSNGVKTVLIRKRPEVQVRQPTWPPGEVLVMPNMRDIPDWTKK